MISEKPLETVEISDYANNDLFFVADSSFSQMFGLPFLIPFLSLFLFTISSFFLPNSKSVITQQYELTNTKGNNIFTINNSISNLSPIYQYLFVNFSIVDPPNDSDISASTHAIFIHENNTIKTLTSTFQSQKATENFTLLDESIVDFDNVILETKISTQTNPNQLYQLTLESMNPSFSISILFCRIAFSLFLIPYIISDIIHISQNTNSFNSYEQILTITLSLMTILYNDPFYSLQLFFPSFYNNFLLVIFRDSYLSYLLFYVFSIYSCFEINKDQDNIFVKFSFNLVLMIVSLSALLWFDLNNSMNLIAYLQKNQNNIINSIFHHHFVFLIIATIMIIIRIFIARSSKSESQAQRYRYYTYSILFVLSLLFFYCSIKYTWPSFLIDGLDTIFPMILFTGYAMFMEYGHEDTEISEEKAYIAPEDMAFDDHLGLGADEDPEQLEKNTKQ